MPLNLILTVSLYLLPKLLPGGEAGIVSIAQGGGEAVAIPAAERIAAQGDSTATHNAPADIPSIPPPFLWKEIATESWAPQEGDHLLIDVERNMGTLVHQNGDVLQFPVITGQQRTVIHIGLRYNAATPKKSWIVRSLDTQGDRITYGPTGRFLRMYDRGTRTHYGIHAHRDEEVMFARDDRYQSMGCIIVEEHILDLLQETFEKNGGTLYVRTYGHDVEMIASASVKNEG